MKYHNLFSLLFALLFIAFSTQAQDQDQRRKERHEKIEAARTAFLTDKMKLTADQAQKFWPVYNEFDAKRKEFRRKSRVFKHQNLESLSEAQLKDQINAMFDLRQKELNLEKEYSDKFLKVINVRQLAAMYQGEREFTKVLLRKLNDYRGDQSTDE